MHATEKSNFLFFLIYLENFLFPWWSLKDICCFWGFMHSAWLQNTSRRGFTSIQFAQSWILWHRNRLAINLACFHKKNFTVWNCYTDAYGLVMNVHSSYNRKYYRFNVEFQLTFAIVLLSTSSTPNSEQFVNPIADGLFELSDGGVRPLTNVLIAAPGQF